MVALLDPVRQGPPLGEAVALHRDHPQAVGLHAWWPTLGSRGTGLLRDCAGRGYHGTASGDPPWLADPLVGAAADLDNTNDYFNLGDNTTVLISGQPFTLAWWERIKSGSGTHPARFRLPMAGGTQAFLVLRSAASGYTYLTWGKGSSTGTVPRAGDAPSLADSLGIWRHFALVGLVGPESVGTPAHWAAYCDGAPLTVIANATYGSIGNVTARIGYDGIDSPANCALADMRVYHRPLSPAEVWQLYAPATRWALYAPTRQVWAVVVSGGASANIIAPAAVLTLTAPAPTVQAQQQAAITAPAAPTTFTAPAPTVVGSRQAAISAPVASVSLTAAAPTVVAVQQASVSAPAASLALTAPAPAVSTGQVASITAPAASVTLRATAPTVTAQQQAAVTAAPGVLTLTTAPPTVVAVSSAAVQAVAGVLTLTAGVPTVSVGAAQAPGAVTGGASALDGVTGGASAQDAVLAGVSS